MENGNDRKPLLHKYSRFFLLLKKLRRKSNNNLLNAITRSNILQKYSLVISF